MKDTNKTILPYNLQFFADPTPEPTPEPAPTPEPDPTPEPQLSAEEQLAKTMAELKRYKSATDKATADASEWKKKYRATLDEKSQLDLEKAERESQFQTEFESLKRENTINKMAKSFIGMGYTEEQAVKASEAQLDGDYDELFRIQNSFITERDKLKESEWMKKMPNPPAGHGDGDKVDPFIAGFDKG